MTIFELAVSTSLTTIAVTYAASTIRMFIALEQIKKLLEKRIR